MSLADPPQLEAFDQVQWIIETIAERNYPVSEPGRSWAGRTMLVTSVADKFKVGDADASLLVDQAIERLFERKSEAPAQVNVRLLIAKIDRHERLLLHQLTAPRERIEYELSARYDGASGYLYDENGNIVYDKVPTKCIVHHEHPVALHRYLIDLYKLKAFILSIKQGGDDMKRAAQLLESLLAQQPGQEVETTLSVSQKVKRMDNAQLDTRAPRRISSKPAKLTAAPSPAPIASAQVVSGNGQPAAAPAPLPDGESRPIE